MLKPLLDVKNLSVRFGQGDGSFLALDGFELTVAKGETVVLVGESGSGKSISALSISRLLPSTALIESGSIEFAGSDLLGLSEKAMRNIRGAGIGMVFQEPQSSLNPVMTIGSQIGESLKRHHGLYGKALLERIEELLVLVGISNPKHRCHQYPHEFSGGMKQRVMIAIALAGDPELLIADEPTTALDVTIQAQVLSLMKTIQTNRNMGMVFITHDLAVAYQVADRIIVMKEGKIIEAADREDFYRTPSHEYTQKLFDSIPSWEKRLSENPSADHPAAEKALNVKNLSVSFLGKTSLFSRRSNAMVAVNNVDLELQEGRTLALVGESGSGKTTMAKAILQLIKPSHGSVYYRGDNLCDISGRQLRRYRGDLQMVFQDPYSSMNPRMLVGAIIKEGMIAQNIGIDKSERDDRVRRLLLQVGLDPSYALRYPHEFSGGQRQRICIARALAVEPKVLICDEPTSALDVSVQSQILHLLRDLQEELGLTYLFVTHNIGVVAYLAHQVAVMHQGKIVEYGSVDDVLHRPQHVYTRALLNAVPKIGMSL
ncbi:ABC transporter ATP-binding protein [Gammaproteobacteria bacterium]|nr:ABC transporter ATP-binding protein [Gammaproteobacteria bacterium]